MPLTWQILSAIEESVSGYTLSMLSSAQDEGAKAISTRRHDLEPQLCDTDDTSLSLAVSEGPDHAL